MKILVILFIVIVIISALLIAACVVAEAVDKEGKIFKLETETAEAEKESDLGENI